MSEDISIFCKTRIINRQKYKVIGKNVEQQKCRIDIFSFFCGQGKNVELEKILQFDIFVVKFEKGKNVELYILKGKNVELKF